MDRLNCWEVMSCGRELCGPAIQAKGICPAALHMHANGLNGGVNAGRICWAIDGTNCGGVPDDDGMKATRCSNCYFFRRVAAEEGQAALTLELPPRPPLLPLI